MANQLIPVPRVESRAPQKNTIEWEIPGKVLVTFMLIERLGYTVIAKVRVEKKHWWSRPWKNFVAHATDSATAILKGTDFLEKYGYTIDHNSIQVGEKIGDPEYFRKLGL